MSISIFLAFAVAAMASGNYGCDVNSLPPKPDHPMQWSEYNGTWYETVTSNDHISLDHKCVTFHDLQIDRTGFHDIITYFYTDGRKIKFDLHVKETEDGYFEEYSVEGKELRNAKHTYLGDPRHYMAYVKCSSFGWTIWAYTREKKVSPELLIFIINDLLKHGVTAPLRLNNC